MPLDVKLYALDATGVLPDNLIPDESIPITSTPDNLFLVVPRFGYYYTDSLVVKHNSTTLPKSKYKFTEYYHTGSLKYGKQICGSILVDITGLTGSLSITYQVLGGESSRSQGNLIDVFYDRMTPTAVVAWDDLRDKPQRYQPKPGHWHNGRDIHDTARLLSHLENIRDALTILESPNYNTLMEYIDNVFSEMQVLGHQFFVDKLPGLIEDFKAQFTKQYFGLDKLVNMAMASNEEAGIAAREGYIFTGTNKYMALSGLVAFKEALYEGIVDILSTNIGTNEPRYITPVRASVLDLPIGANASYIGQDAAIDNGISFSGDLYPQGTVGSKRFTITKVSKLIGPEGIPLTQGGEIVTGFDHTATGMWLGHHNEQLRWSQMYFDGALQPIEFSLASHNGDRGNPHRLKKSDIRLGYMENLPVVSVQALKEMRGEREYITADIALKLMGLLEYQEFWVSGMEADRNRFKLDNAQVVYSMVGNCGCDDRSDFGGGGGGGTTPEEQEYGYVCRKSYTLYAGDGTTLVAWPEDWPDEWEPDTYTNEEGAQDVNIGNLWRLTYNSTGTVVAEQLWDYSSLSCLAPAAIAPEPEGPEGPEYGDVFMIVSTADYNWGDYTHIGLDLDFRGADFIPFRNVFTKRLDEANYELYPHEAATGATFIPLANGNIGFQLNDPYVVFDPAWEVDRVIVSGILDMRGNLIADQEVDFYNDGHTTIQVTSDVTGLDLMFGGQSNLYWSGPFTVAVSDVVREKAIFSHMRDSHINYDSVTGGWRLVDLGEGGLVQWDMEGKFVKMLAPEWVPLNHYSSPITGNLWWSTAGLVGIDQQYASLVNYSIDVVNECVYACYRNYSQKTYGAKYTNHISLKILKINYLTGVVVGETEIRIDSIGKPAEIYPMPYDLGGNINFCDDGKLYLCITDSVWGDMDDSRSWAVYIDGVFAHGADHTVANPDHNWDLVEPTNWNTPVLVFDKDLKLIKDHFILTTVLDHGTGDGLLFYGFTQSFIEPRQRAPIEANKDGNVLISILKKPWSWSHEGENPANEGVVRTYRPDGVCVGEIDVDDWAYTLMRGIDGYRSKETLLGHNYTGFLAADRLQSNGTYSGNDHFEFYNEYRVPLSLVLAKFDGKVIEIDPGPGGGQIEPV